MATSPQKIRLFIGVFPPEEVAQWMLARLDDIDLPESRSTPVQQVHLTVHFVGSVIERELGSIIASVEHAAKGLGPFDVKPNSLISLPRQGPARLMALESNASASLHELRRRLVVRLADTSRKRGKKQFLPHFTLCRFSRPQNMEPIEIRIEGPSLRFSEVRLIQSKLTAGGAFYEEISEFPLRG